MNDALKELFNAYKHLPVGVMFFKEKKLFFVNDHLRSTLLLADLSSDDVIQIIGGMIGLEEPSHLSLVEFLSGNKCFIYRDRVIQIENKEIDGIDIFVLVRLSDKAIQTVDASRSLRILRQEKAPSVHTDSDEHAILKKALGNWEEGHFPSLVLYKGIPIKGEITILEAHEGKIKLHVEKKQLVAAEIGVEWLIGTKRDQMVSGTLAKYNLDEHTVWIENIHIVDQGFHLRSVIRYDADENDLFEWVSEGKKYRLPLRDVSEKGISILTDNSAVLVALGSSGAKTLKAVLVLNGTAIAVMAVWRYTAAVDDSEKMKAAFTIGYDLHNGTLLREWLNGRQLRRIKEVQNFVRTIAAPKNPDQGDWVI